jgi:hypothetical protein
MKYWEIHDEIMTDPTPIICEVTPRTEQPYLPRRRPYSVACWILPITGRELQSDRAQGAQGARDWLSALGR